MSQPACVSLVCRLARNANRLRNLLPGPPSLDRKIDRLALHAIGESSQGDDGRQGGRRIIRPGRDLIGHARMLRCARGIVNVR